MRKSTQKKTSFSAYLCASASSAFILRGSLLAASLLFAGCDSADPPQFHLNQITMIENEITEAQQKDIATVLSALFGTPDEPQVLGEMGLDINKIQMAAGHAWSDREGTKYGLYRRHCVHCHGITGDGHGPTAPFLNPYPRDFRAGKFKFKSTERTAMPTRQDLLHTLREGIPGTAMPSFKLLPPDELDALVEYVRYLTLRGRMEAQLGSFTVDELEINDPDTKDVDETTRLVGVDESGNVDFDKETIVDGLLADELAAWEEAADQVIRPDDEVAPPTDRTAEQVATSTAIGRELFFGAKANCFSCHGPTALGDGQTTDVDDWNKVTKEFLEKYDDLTAASVGALPVRNIRPRNLRTGVYRGGRKPRDVYRRLYAGINGTPMPAVGPSSPGGEGTLTDEEMWQLVDYVMSLPYEPASQPPSVSLPENKRIRH